MRVACGLFIWFCLQSGSGIAQDSSEESTEGSTPQPVSGQGCRTKSEEKHYSYLNDVLKSNRTNCTLRKECGETMRESCDILSDGVTSTLVSTSWNDKCGGACVRDQAKIIITLDSVRRISTVRISAKRGTKKLDEIWINDREIKLAQESPFFEYITVGEISPPIKSDTLRVEFKVSMGSECEALFLSELEVYALPDGTENIFNTSQSDLTLYSTLSCQSRVRSDIGNTCIAFAPSESCRCLFDQDTDSGVLSSISWTFINATVAFRLQEDLTLLYSRLYIFPLQCEHFEIHFKCGGERSEDPCVTATPVISKSRSDLNSTKPAFWWVIPLNQLSGTTSLCIEFRCTPSNAHIRVIEVEIFARTGAAETTTQPSTTTAPASDDTTFIEESTAKEVTTSTAEETTAVPGLSVDCSMTLLQDFDEGYGEVGSPKYTGLLGNIQPLIDSSFTEVYGVAFLSTYGWIFSEGSVQTQYTADLKQGSTLNSDQQEILRNTIVDTLKANNITVDPNSLDFTPRTTTTEPPAKADTEQLLLAGVMGAVVTLLVIALAIAAVAVRLCINRRRREQSGQGSFDNMNTDLNPMQHYPSGYHPNTMPPPYPRNGSVSTQSQYSSVPGYFTSSLPRYGRYPFQPQASRPVGQMPRSSNHDAFEFPTPMVAQGMSARRSESDVSEDSRDRSGRRHSSLTGYVPRHTQIPRVTPSHRQFHRDYSTNGNSRFHRTPDTEPNLHRNRTGLSMEDLFTGHGRPRMTRQDVSDSANRPRLRRLPSSSEGHDSRTRSNDAFEDDALRPYYLANEENEQESGGIFERLSRTFPVSKEDEPDNLHRQKPPYVKARKSKGRKDSSNSRI